MNENNVAAQAGDEPMPEAEIHAVLDALPISYWDVPQDATVLFARAIIEKYRASQVSPRATADVERLDKLITMAPNSFSLIGQKWHLLDPRGRIAGKGETKRDAIDAAIATTMPGA